MWMNHNAPFCTDADMLLIGNGCITEDEEHTQMAIWSIIASPLIMGNDMRNVLVDSKAILFNKDAIAVNQVGRRSGPLLVRPSLCCTASCNDYCVL